MAIASKCICGHSPNYCNDSVKECMKRIDLHFKCAACDNKDKRIEELEKENERLSAGIKKIEKSFDEQAPVIEQAVQWMADQITALQSQCTEKEKLVSELRKEADKNYGFIWKAFHLSVCDLPQEEQDKYWAEFLTKNNL